MKLASLAGWQLWITHAPKFRWELGVNLVVLKHNICFSIYLAWLGSIPIQLDDSYYDAGVFQ